MRSSAWRRRLAARGVDPLALRVIGTRATLEEAWRACPRVDWALEIAVRGRVEPALVREGLREVAEETEAWPAAPTDVLDDLRGLDPHEDEALEALGAMLRELVERAPELEAAARELREAERWKLRARTQAAADAYDDRHRAIHRRLAERFRAAVPAEAVRFALGEQRAHPYR